MQRRDSAVAEGKTQMKFAAAAADDGGGARLKKDNGADAETLMSVAADGAKLKHDVGTDAPWSSAGSDAPGCGSRVEDSCCNQVPDEPMDPGGWPAVSLQTPQ